MSDISNWYKQVPYFTRIWLTATVAISLLAKLQVLPTAFLYLDAALVFKKFQVSRKPFMGNLINNQLSS